MGAALLALLVLSQQADFQSEGMKALEERRYEAAAQAFEKAVAADEKDYAARFHLALAQSFLGRSADAIAGYRKVLELKPGLYEAELNLGVLLLEHKDAGASLPHLQSAAEKKPAEFRPQLYLAEALQAAGRAAEAERAYRRAAELDPKSAAAAAGLGRAIARQNRLQEAEAHFRKAAELDPAYDRDLLELASLYENGKQYGEAIQIYQRFSGDAAAQERLGGLLLETGRPAEAIPPLEAAVKASPTAANRYALATAYLRTKQQEKASAMLEQALAAEPQNADLRLTYGRVLRDARRFPDAAKQFWQVTQAKPDSKEAWSELASMLLLMENYPQALAAFDRLEALGEQGAALHYFRAIALDRSRQYKAALASYERFLALSGGQHPDEEFKARQRVKVIHKEIERR